MCVDSSSECKNLTFTSREELNQRTFTNDSASINVLSMKGTRNLVHFVTTKRKKSVN